MLSPYVREPLFGITGVDTLSRSGYRVMHTNEVVLADGLAVSLPTSLVVVHDLEGNTTIRTVRSTILDSGATQIEWNVDVNGCDVPITAQVVMGRLSACGSRGSLNLLGSLADVMTIVTTVGESDRKFHRPDVRLVKPQRQNNREAQRMSISELGWIDGGNHIGVLTDRVDSCLDPQSGYSVNAFDTGLVLTYLPSEGELICRMPLMEASVWSDQIMPNGIAYQHQHDVVFGGSRCIVE